jgi:hypothetical protein
MEEPDPWPIRACASYMEATNFLPAMRRAERTDEFPRESRSSAAQNSVASSESDSLVVRTAVLPEQASAIIARASAIALFLGLRCEEGTMFCAVAFVSPMIP